MGGGAALFLIFAAAAIVGALLSLDAPPARRIAVHTLNRALHALFAGEVVIGAIDHLGLGRIAVRDVVVRDPRGGAVMELQGIEARASALAIAHKALSGRGDIAIDLASLSIDRAEVLTTRGPSGTLTVREAFQPRTPSPPRPPRPDAPKVLVNISRINIESAFLHGEIADGRPLDATARDLRGALSIDPSGLSISLSPTHVIERRALPAPIAGELQGLLRVRTHGLLATGDFRGRVGDIEAALTASVDGDHVKATAAAPTIVPKALAALLGSSPLTRPVSLDLHAEGTLPTFSVEAELAALGATTHVRAEGTIDLGPPLAARLDARARALDPRLFAPSAPAASIDARVRTNVVLGGGPPRVVADVDTAPGFLAGQRVPAISAHVDVDRGALRAAFAVRERGIPLSGRLTLTEDKLVRFDVHAAVPAIRDAPRLHGLLDDRIDGSARLRIRGTFARGRLDAALDGDVSLSPTPSARAPVTLRRGALTAHLRGPLGALAAHAELRAEGIAAFGSTIERLTAEARGVLSPDPHAELDLVVNDGSTRALRGISTRLHAALRGGALTAEGEARLAGLRGATAPVATIRLERASALLRGPLTAARTWKDLPFEAALRAEDLDLAGLARISRFALPPAISAISGLVNASLTVARDPGDRLPSIHALTLRTRALAASGPSFHEDALDLALSGDFSGRTGLARGRAMLLDARSNGAAVVTADLGLLVSLDALLGDKSTAGLPLSGGVRAEIHDLPLARLPFLEALPIAGRNAGSPEALRGVLRGSAALDARGDTGNALLALSFLGGDQGRLDAAVNIGIHFGEAAGADKQRPASATVAAQGFRMAMLRPLLGEAVSRLDGRLDGNIDLRWARFGDAKGASVEGALHVTGGAVEIPAIGQDLRDVELTLTADPRSIVRLSRITARASRGSFHGSAEARFDGLDLIHARAALTVPNGEDIPLTINGIAVGDVRGFIDAEARRAADGIDMVVKVPAMHVTLPPSLDKRVQRLDPNPDIVIRPPLEPPEERTAPRAGAPRITIVIEPGEIEVEGKGADITLTGDPRTPLRITLGDKALVSGDLKIVRGKVDVLGKDFEIEPGSSIHLRPEDKANPFLNVSAAWTAPDETRVTVAYVGTIDPITPDKLKLSSEPPKSEQALMSLILLGPEHEEGTLVGGASSGPSEGLVESAAGAATSLGSSFASSQLNRIIHGIAPLSGLSVELAPEATGGLKTSVGYKFSKSLSATATVAGSGGGAFSFEWRFRPRWSVRVSVSTGDATSSWVPQTSIDLLWTKRY